MSRGDRYVRGSGSRERSVCAAERVGAASVWGCDRSWGAGLGPQTGLERVGCRPRGVAGAVFARFVAGGVGGEGSPRAAGSRRTAPGLGVGGGSLVLLGDAGHRARRGGHRLNVAAVSLAKVRRDFPGRVVGVLWVDGWEGEDAVKASGEVAFEAAQRALFGFALALFAREVLLGRWIVVRAGDRDDVQCVVELAIPAAVESILGALP